MSITTEEERNASVARTETATEILEEAARWGCHFVNQGDGPECKVEWPDSSAFKFWCTSCFAKKVIFQQRDELFKRLDRGTKNLDAQLREEVIRQVVLGGAEPFYEGEDIVGLRFA
jgi:nicotinamidase-related amidase